MNKVPLLLSIICFVIYRLLLYFTHNIGLSLLIFLVPIGLLVFNLSVRKRLSYSNWFLSSRNFLHERRTHSSESELDTELLYAKLLEVFENLEFDLLDHDENKLKMLLGTSTNFLTWGENIYIQIAPSSNGSMIEFTSVTLFGNTSWKRNDKNFDSFIESFESSLIV
ncbi:hypothetical protein [Fluviicola taffensis]|uniref:hypothetical protein n=1 Tax=Fluviicola taffensis TaxID=191579 RepID=UPI00313790B8